MLVQASPSSQGSVFGTCWQPLAGSQPSSVHGLPSSHATAAPGRQLPAEQLSPEVQASASSQLPASGTQSVQSALLSSLQSPWASQRSAMRSR